MHRLLLTLGRNKIDLAWDEALWLDDDGILCHGEPFLGRYVFSTS